MKNVILGLGIALSSLMAQTSMLFIYPSERLGALLQEHPGIIERAMMNACERASNKYIAGFVIKFTEEGDILVEAITIEGDES